MTAFLPETVLTVAAAVLYVSAWAAELTLLTHPRRWLGFASTGGMWIGLALQTAGIAWRWQAIGHPPVMGSFENSMVCAWFLVAGTLLLRRVREWRSLPVGVLPASVIVIVWGMRFSANRLELTISERSLWIDLHALVAWIAFFAATAAVWACVLSVVRAWEERRGRPLAAAATLPARKWADEMVMQAVTYSFLGVTALLASGAWYSWLLFGETWRWDLVEVLGLITWIVLGLAVHARMFYGWRGLRLAILYMAAYLGIVSMYWLLALFPFASYHFFELPF
ncbi:MAG: cytochrome c biogenesis protein CcsA [Coriobacteriia bacterium]|nr:cytochrome c biogenesis protein CcsA [Coriobacteriia bacterium]